MLRKFAWKFLLVNSDYKSCHIYEIRGDNRLGGKRLIFDHKKGNKVYYTAVFGKNRDWVATISPDWWINIYKYDPKKNKLLISIRHRLDSSENQEAATITGSEENNIILVQVMGSSYHCKPEKLLAFEFVHNKLELRDEISLDGVCERYMYSFEYFKKIGDILIFVGIECYSEENKISFFCYDIKERKLTFVKEAQEKVKLGYCTKLLKVSDDYMYCCFEKNKIGVFEVNLN